jgi:quinoprotein glucose dehydrogenase
MLRTSLKVAMWVAPLAVVLAGTPLMVSGQAGITNGEWPHWGADLGNTKYSAWIANHPALKGVTIPRTGRADEGGIVVTKTLMFAGQGCGLFRAGAGGSEMFYAYDKATGDVVHELTLPGGTCGNPMTYAINGKQYITVSVGSRTTTAEIVALALP